MARIDFVDDGEPINDPFALLPDGTEVIAELVKSEMKATSKGDGHYLALEFKSIDDDVKGRTFFANLNLDNPNDKAVTIAQRELKALVRAAGKTTAQDSEELHGIPVCLVLGVEPARGEYEARNKIKNYKPASEKGQKAKKAAPKNGETPQKSEPPKQAPWAR